MRLFMFLGATFPGGYTKTTSVIVIHASEELEKAVGKRRIEGNMTPVIVVGTIASLVTVAVVVALITSCRSPKRKEDDKKKDRRTVDSEVGETDDYTPLSTGELTAISKSKPATTV